MRPEPPRRGPQTALSSMPLRTAGWPRRAACVVLAVAMTLPAAHGRDAWQFEQRLDRDGVVVLRWNALDKLDGVLVLEVAARTRGYVGLGLSPYTGTMAGADLVMAWVDDAGAPHARDYWADQNGSPTLDKAQDWAVVGAQENDTHTVVRLARPVHTGHVMDVQIQPGPMRVIFSWSGADPGRTPHYHGKEQRGVSEVCLLSPSAASVQRPWTRSPVAWSLAVLLHVVRWRRYPRHGTLERGVSPVHSVESHSPWWVN